MKVHPQKAQKIITKDEVGFTSLRNPWSNIGYYCMSSRTVCEAIVGKHSLQITEFCFYLRYRWRINIFGREVVHVNKRVITFILRSFLILLR